MPSQSSEFVESWDPEQNGDGAKYTESRSGVRCYVTVAIYRLLQRMICSAR